ncbi:MULTISPECIES: helix-turn-helix transcriptional regulator [unclassified Streptomyces]|uniref:helix-turn-helix domain-containing protein n=1 Tax=unclassified Streptomyces TaxID=2593676 RepID=UPI0003A54DAD|nr:MULTISPECIES: helix-turn-helix transcriptional regulator [unclassified Streptomyces]MYT33527.1 helix-turn-helix domain-containing protein [Streptomyces sp. SID8354]
MPPRRVVTGRSPEPRRRFAEELRLLRAEKGDSLRQLSEVLGWDASLFGKMENGRTLGSPEVVEALAQHYGTGDLLLALWELAVGDPTQFKEQYRRYMTLESEAVSLWHFGHSTIHGLLQTEGYARDLLKAGGIEGEELTRQVEARMGRRQSLEGDEPPQFRTILSEAVLRTPLADASEWRKQLEYLIEASARSNITLQVLPFSAGLNGLDSTAVIFLRLPSGFPVAYTENAHRGELIEESASVERLQRAYDAVRDRALVPDESRKFVMRMLEEVPCEPST